MKRRTIIALLTDFGADDGYVASMKGILLSRAPGAEIIDITHTISPQQVRSAAYVLWSVYRLLPAGSIVVAVVDPGVGTTRQLCCTRADGYYFFHPENGILDLVLASATAARSVVLDNARYHRAPVSSTFHGRDILAPAAAALASGIPMRALGSPRTVRRPNSILQKISAGCPGTYRGSILHVDHFGNLVTNFSVAGALPTAMRATIRRTPVRSVHPQYADAPPDTPFLLAGSSGLLEVAVRNGSAARALRVSLNDPITLSIRRGTR